jgi:hypothetical protein
MNVAMDHRPRADGDPAGGHVPVHQRLDEQGLAAVDIAVDGQPPVLAAFDARLSARRRATKPQWPDHWATPGSLWMESASKLHRKHRPANR